VSHRFSEEAVRGFVLAGGLSSRMGRDKATLEYRGEPFLRRALRSLAEVSLTPMIVGQRPELSLHAPVIPDRRLGVGPLGGLEAALGCSDCDLNLFLPVDLPLLPSTFLRFLVQRARMTRAVATVPLVNGRPQPLVAVYRRSLLALIQEALEGQSFKVMSPIYRAKELAGGLDLFHVELLYEVEEGWPYRWFQNFNEPGDLAMLESIAPS
jgi:molybdopterin-guanine dinucleotide biosynthesis protein A